MDQLTTNFLVMGRSGAGKSSLINYIYGEYKRETGTGRPVTSVGLHRVVLKRKDITVNLYDTWGLEANKADEWKDVILNEAKCRNESFTIKDWFHTIVYCLSAQSARVEDFEINEIINPLIEQGNNVIIVLTHGDVIGVEKKSRGMIDYLLKKTKINKQNIIMVASEAKKLLGGGAREQFGKEEVLYRMRKNLWLDIRNKLPKAYCKYSNNQFDCWKKDSYAIVEKKVKFWNRHSVSKKIIPPMNDNLRRRFERIDNETDKYIKDAYMYYVRLAHYLLGRKVSAKTDFNEEHYKNRFDYKMDLVDKIAEKIAVAILSLLPVVSLFIPYAAKEIAKDSIKEVIDQHHSGLLNQIPDYVRNLEKIIDEQCKEILLLESSD
ncbi:MAG: GTPase [Alkaliphilus sp.]